MKYSRPAGISLAALTMSAAVLAPLPAFAQSVSAPAPKSPSQSAAAPVTALKTAKNAKAPGGGDEDDKLNLHWDNNYGTTARVDILMVQGSIAGAPSGHDTYTSIRVPAGGNLVDQPNHRVIARSSGGEVKMLITIYPDAQNKKQEYTFGFGYKTGGTCPIPTLGYESKTTKLSRGGVTPKTAEILAAHCSDPQNAYINDGTPDNTQHVIKP